MITHGILHHTILEHIIREGHAPTLTTIAKTLQISEQDAQVALIALEEYHGVVLHPDKTKIWVIHPFSLAPTPFLVRTESGTWWGNCAWCSLGAAAFPLSL